MKGNLLCAVCRQPLLEHNILEPCSTRTGLGIEPAQPAEFDGKHKEPVLHRQPGQHSERQPCGTAAAYRRHFRQGTPPCEACREANRIYIAEYRERRTGAR